MPELPAHASPAFNPIYSPQLQSSSRQSFDFSLSHDDDAHASHDGHVHSNPHDHLPSLISPAFTPPATPGASTPNRIPRSVAVDTSLTSDTPSPTLLNTLPTVNCEVRARIPTVAGQEMFLHVYSNNVDKKEHLAIVFGNHIRSKSLDAERPGETEFARMTRGAYVGRLYPGRTTSRVDQIRQEEGVAPRKADSPSAPLPGKLGATASATGLPSTRTPGEREPQAVDPESVPPLIRIHSECYTGETVWSARCDCGEQLEEAARLMALDKVSPSGGAIIYLRQEGRGIGLSEKLKAYNLQDLGNDTYEANLLLRHPADARSYGLATAMLMDLGLGGERGIRLLTNNPDKIRAVEGPNREVVVRERVAMVPLAWKTNGKLGIKSEEVEKYLSTKIEKFKHLLDQR